MLSSALPPWPKFYLHHLETVSVLLSALWPGPAWSPWKLHFLASGHGMVMCECERGRQGWPDNRAATQINTQWNRMVLRHWYLRAGLAHLFYHVASFTPIRLTFCCFVRRRPASCVLRVMSWPGSPCLGDMNALAASQGGRGGDLWGAGDMWRDSGHRQPRSAQCQSGLATDSTLLSQLPSSSLVTCPPE